MPPRTSALVRGEVINERMAVACMFVSVLRHSVSLFESVSCFGRRVWHAAMRAFMIALGSLLQPGLGIVPLYPCHVVMVFNVRGGNLLGVLRVVSLNFIRESPLGSKPPFNGLEL